MSAQKTQHMEDVPRRKSRRIQGLAPQMDRPPTKAVYLPPELKANVLAQLDKRNLKNVRLVSKEWNVLATRPLFKRIYISCRAKDLEVFENITSHPVISKGVRELVYDGSLFQKGMTISDYFWHLYRCLPCITLDFKSGRFNCANNEINIFIADYRNKAVRIYEKHIRDDFIVEGHKSYQNYAEAERRAFETGHFLSKLCGGLRRLENLRSVILNSSLWTYDLYENKRTGSVKPNTLHGPDSGSPLVRSWNPLHLRPFFWNCDEMRNERSLFCHHFYTLTAAITETHRNIKSLEIPFGEMGGLPPQVLVKPTITDDLFYRTLHAYSGLEVLNISICASENDGSDDIEALATLPRMLQQMTGLKKLTLDLSKEMYKPSGPTREFYTYQQVFPTIAMWPRITELSIKGLAIGRLDLYCLVGVRAKVTDLTLHCIELLDGTWEGVIEALSHNRRLTELFLRGYFKHRGGQTFPQDKRTGWHPDQQTLRALEEYVMYGGRHPCLAPDDDPDSAFWWYLDLLSDNEFKELKTFALESGLEIPKIKRPANVQASQKLHDSVMPSVI